MSATLKRMLVFILSITLVVVLSAACDPALMDAKNEESGNFATRTPEAVGGSSFGWTAEPSKIPENSAEGIVFAFSGENPAYHTGLLNKTVFYLNYDQGTAWANESQNFEQPAGIQVRKGTDTVNFNGTYDHQHKLIDGTLKIRTEGTASGGDAAGNTLTYMMTGQLQASLINGKWVGTVVGQASLTQSWEDSEKSDDQTKSAINWTAESVSIEKY